MGDAGSIVLGFILIVSGLQILKSNGLHGNTAILPMVVIAVLFIPVFDALRVFKNRMKSGKSPFHSDKTHLHHLVLFLGLKHHSAAISVLLMILFILAIGIGIFHLAGLTTSIISMFIVFFIMTSVLQFHQKLIQWQQKIKKLEMR